jgi:hypothetical protein
VNPIPLINEDIWAWIPPKDKIDRTSALITSYEFKTIPK